MSEHHLDGASDYAAGALDAEERTEFERHLAAGCEPCAREVAAHAETLAGLARAWLPASPDPRLREQVLELAEAPALPLDLGSYAWQEAAPGVRIHVVKDDPARDFRACLVWADPGAVHPAHRHHGDEVILVLQGALEDARGHYGAGEICRSRPGSVHSERALPGQDCICYVLYYGRLEPVGSSS